MSTTTIDAMVTAYPRQSCVRPWRGTDRAHTGVLAGFQGCSVPAADRAERAVMGFIGDTQLPNTGDVYPQPEAVPV